MPVTASFSRKPTSPAVVSDTRVESVFALTDAIGTGDHAAALRLLQRLLDDGAAAAGDPEHAHPALPQLWKARELLAQGVPQKELPRRIGINPYFVGSLLTQAQLYGDRQLRETFPRLLAVDLALKSGGDARGPAGGADLHSGCWSGRNHKERGRSLRPLVTSGYGWPESGFGHGIDQFSSGG